MMSDAGSDAVTRTGNFPCKLRVPQYPVYQVMIQLLQTVVHRSLVNSGGSFPNLHSKSGVLPPHEWQRSCQRSLWLFACQFSNHSLDHCSYLKGPLGSGVNGCVTVVQRIYNQHSQQLNRNRILGLSVCFGPCGIWSTQLLDLC
jgi:hypothetical protein